MCVCIIDLVFILQRTLLNVYERESERVSECVLYRYSIYLTKDFLACVRTHHGHISIQSKTHLIEHQVYIMHIHIHTHMTDASES